MEPLGTHGEQSPHRALPLNNRFKLPSEPRVGQRGSQPVLEKAEIRDPLKEHAIAGREGPSPLLEVNIFFLLPQALIKSRDESLLKPAIHHDSLAPDEKSTREDHRLTLTLNESEHGPRAEWRRHFPTIRQLSTCQPTRS